MVKELICLILHRLVCLQLQESICLVQQELIRLKQLELICITLHGLVCLKQEELYCVVQVWSFLKQQGIFNPLVCFILHGLGFGKQEKLFCAVQQGLVWLKKSHWKLQQELICLILHVLDYLQQQETICLVQNELVCLNHSCMKQQGLVYLLQEPMCLILHGLVCLQLELMCLIQKGLICLVQHKLICIKQFGLVRLPHQELMYFVQLGLVSLELTTCTVTASPQQQQLLCMKQKELLCLKDLHIVEYITKNFSLIDIQCHNVNEPDNKVCKFVHKVRNGSDHVCLCGLIIALFLGTGETVRIKDQDCNPADAVVPDASIIPLYHFALKNVRVTQIDDIQYNHGIASYVHYRNSYEKYKTRLKNAHFDLQQDSCLGLQLYGSILKRKNVLSANILLCTPSVEIGGKMMLHVDVAVEVTIWNSSRIGSVWKFESFQHFEYILFSKQVLKVADSLPCTMETECTMATENTNTKMFCKDIQCQIDIPTDETHCTLVVSATKSAPFCWSSHHELVVTRISSFDLMMKSDISRPVGKGSDPHASHPNKHQQQKDFTSVEADGRRTSAVGYQAAAAIEYHKKSQTGVNNDMSSSVHGNLDCDVVPDSRTKCSSQCQKDSQLWITPEGLSLNEDQNQLHTKVVPDCEVKHKFDATTSIIGQDVVKDGKGAADSSTLLQPAVTVGNSFAFNSTNGITQNVVKDGRGAVETKPIALLPSTSSVNSSLSAKMPAAQKTVVKSSTVSKAHDSGPQLIKTLPTEADHLPPLGLQYNVLYDTNARDEVPLAQDEKSGSVVKQKVDKTIRKHYQKDFPSTTQHKNSAVKNNTSKTGVQKPPFPKRCCIVAGNKMFTLDPNLLAHPHMDTYFVKERTETRPGHFLARLVLHHVYLDKIHATNEDITAAQQSQAASIAAESEAEKDGGAVTERKHFPLNVNRAGYIVFSSDLTRFSGSMKYPLPSRKATAIKVGKGGNGFVFLIFHSGKEYAVKKTVYRANEIRIHSQLDHPNLLNLDAVLVGEEHERHRGKFYAFCFMPKCDMDLRSVISTKQHGCLKHLKMQLVEQRNIWEVVVVNIKYILKSLLKALEYMHNLGLVHRDVKASNILLKMKCPCTKPLMCSCPQKYVVKLGDFDSSTIVPGFGLKIEPHQMIRYASVLPLGTMGYRAPEVSMHLVISGPYEVLYTTAVDIWSFGCLLLNMLIGKNGPLKQRGEAALLLSAQEQPYSKELYHKIIKVNEVQKYYSDIPEFVDLVYKCLQVDVHCRPNARQLLQLDIMQNK